MKNLISHLSRVFLPAIAIVFVVGAFYVDSVSAAGMIEFKGGKTGKLGIVGKAAYDGTVKKFEDTLRIAGRTRSQINSWVKDTLAEYDGVPGIITITNLVLRVSRLLNTANGGIITGRNERGEPINLLSGVMIKDLIEDSLKTGTMALDKLDGIIKDTLVMLKGESSLNPGTALEYVLQDNDVDLLEYKNQCAIGV